jgi:hypothetical protein
MKSKKSSKGDVMPLSEDQLEQLNRLFKRIFALPISRMTIREVQNAVSTAIPSNPDAFKSIMESLLSGEMKGDIRTSDGTDLSNFVETYSYPVRLSKEVAEMGEFMNSFNCEFLQQGNQVYFVNRMRRIDGQEYYFLSMPETNIRLAHMFVNRLQDLKKALGRLKLDPRVAEELANIKNDIDTLLS